MRKILLIILLTCLSILFSSCNSNKNTQTNYAVHNWNYILHNGNNYSLSDKYGNSFNHYNIFDKLSDETIYAIYFSNGEESGEVELKPYIGNIHTNFISQVEHWYSLFEPLVYGNIDNPRFNYLDIYYNVSKISILITSNDSDVCKRGEYVLSDNLSREIWSVLNNIEKNISDTSDLKWKKANLDAWIYLYIKDVNAAVCVGTICYSTDDQICISNTNYSKLYPLPSQWQNLNVLFENCEFVEHSLLNNY